jgi:hypothetical protein
MEKPIKSGKFGEEGSILPLARISIAPMMDWTDKKEIQVTSITYPRPYFFVAYMSPLAKKKIQGPVPAA